MNRQQKWSRRLILLAVVVLLIGVGLVTYRILCSEASEEASPMSRSSGHGQPAAGARDAADADTSADELGQMLMAQWRVEDVQQQKIDELIAYLNSVDKLNAGSGGGSASSVGSIDHELAVLSMAHVRHLLALGREHPDVVVPALRTSYQDALKAFPGTLHEHFRAIRERDPTTKADPDDLVVLRTRAVAATYLLAELQVHEALPELVAGYRLQHQWAHEGVQETLVPQGIALYALHRLVSTVDVGKLTPEAQAARRTYLAWAETHLPPEQERQVMAWHADYDESDPMRRIVDPEGKVLRAQPTTKITWYPVVFRDVTPFHQADYGGGKCALTAKAQHWADLLLPCAEGYRGPAR